MQQVRSHSGHYRMSPWIHGVRGMGADVTPTQIVGQIGGASGGVVSSLAAPAVADALSITPSLAAGLVGIAFAGVLMGVEAILNSGCGQSCIVTSQWANQAEPLLLQDLQTYFSIAAPRSLTDQQSALNMFDAIWAGLVQRCSQPGLSTAGQDCISDRQRGACKWKQIGQPQYPGQPSLGACWNWFNAYRDPIALDPVDTSVPSLLGGASSSISSALTSISTSTGIPVLLLVGAGFILLAMGSN